MRWVVHKPRQHLRVDEAVRPISVVRRTGPAALRHLSQHSEHWETRTVNGLRAARLLARVIDDDLDLYENRFVVTLMKVLRMRMAKIVTFADIGFSQAQNAIDIESYVDELNDYRAQKMLKALLPTSTTDEMLEEFYLYEGILKKARAIIRVLSECEETQLYRKLKNSPLVQEPILPTNILTMDPHYRELLNLWRDLKRLLPEDEGTGELPPDMDAAYLSYCQVMILAAIHHAGFKPEGGPEQICLVQKTGGYTFASGQFENRDWIIALGQQESMRYGLGLALSFRRKLPSKFLLPIGVERPDIPPALSSICRYADRSIEFTDRPNDQELTALSELVHEATRTRQHRTRRGSHDEAVLWKTFVWDRVRPQLPRPVQFDCALVPVLSAIGADAYDLEKNSELLLGQMLEETKRSNLKSLLLLVPTSPRQVSAETPGFVVRRLLNFGDSYFSDDASRWGQGRTGVLPVSPCRDSRIPRVLRSW